MSDSHPDVQCATDFIWQSARLIDRLRFAHLFLDGDPEAVRAALQAYRNPDGGFGHALEPDLRTPHSQPAAVAAAFEMLDRIDGFGHPMVAQACDYLMTITTPEGGVPFVLPSAADHPHAPWWQAPDEVTAAVTFTAPIAGLLHKHAVDHPWLARATGYCWRRVEAFEVPEAVGSEWDLKKIGTSYAVRAMLAFLDHAPDRPRAEEAFDRIGRLVLDRELVALDPEASGEVHRPLDYAPAPDRMARALFSDAVIDAHLDARVAAQQEDGGWMFGWTAWNAATTLEWRGWLTVETLLTLRAYGRIR